MITARGEMVFETRTDPAGLLRGLVDFVEDLQYQGVESVVSVTVTVGDHEGAKGREGAKLYVNGASAQAATVDHEGAAVRRWSTPDEWGQLWPAVEPLEMDVRSWRKVPRATRWEIVMHVVRAAAVRGQRDFDAVRPDWMSTASSMPLAFGGSWAELMEAWRADWGFGKWQDALEAPTAMQSAEDAGGADGQFRRA